LNLKESFLMTNVSWYTYVSCLKYETFFSFCHVLFLSGSSYVNH
jgi:hypothetical protein